MATASELLGGNILTIDVNSRIINIPASIKTIGVESDDEVQKLNFSMPRKYNDIDFSEFDIRINYKNAKGGEDVYVVDDAVIDDETISFTWIVERFALMYAGTVTFSVCLREIGSNEEILRELNTTIASLPVLKGLETDDAEEINYEAGKKARDTEWWDDYMPSTDNVRYLFAGSGWNVQSFRPMGAFKRNIVSALSMFEAHNMHYPTYDLAARLAEQGFVLDFSTAKSMYGCFSTANISRVGVIDLTSVSSTNNSNLMFANSQIVTIDEIIFNEKTFDWHNNMFQNAVVENLTVSGVLANTINFQWCPLTPESMKSIISILKNFIGTSAAYTKSITFNDNCWAALEADSTSPSGNTWREYVGDLGWNT